MAATVAAPPKAEDSSAKQQAAAQQQQEVWEEDAFEEFDNEDWAIVSHEENQELWQADWDDDDPVVDDFSARLKDELDKTMKE